MSCCHVRVRLCISTHWLTLRVVFFLFTTRCPPLSTLFPYTTLFRSRRTRRTSPGAPSPARRPACRPPPSRYGRAPSRSEEHTSELQSHSELVCRLLLEKKK